jgi:hypothetical protein
MTAAQLANLKPPFTKETARINGRKGGLAKARIPKPIIIEPIDSESPRLALLAEQITLTRDKLNKERMEPHHRAALLRALTGLLEQERIWSGRPLPGTLKPRQPDAKVAAPLPQPVVEKQELAPVVQGTAPAPEAPNI